MHTYTLPLALGGFGSRADSRLGRLVALIWAGHIGGDRFFGDGFKFESGFTETHPATQPTPVDAFTESDR
ncbi:DUF4260 family protein [Halarchaeum sp. CBA1220]|uniref:DUF4260 family protein n=1 Tax=Halarchaeum sp. CBA1220 TaxID=1853682 RepID=UPI002101FF33|nr:DUF4260 family protein [Halarchaeum sp. CBA1220]